MKKLFMLFSFCPYFLFGQIEINFENRISDDCERYPSESGINYFLSRKLSLPDSPGLHDLVINEVMFDPSPTVHLPEADYVELYNTSSVEINLLSWRISAGTNKWVLPDCIIKPKDYLLVSGSEEFKNIVTNYVKPAGPLNFLSISAKDVFLTDPEGIIIDAMKYDPEWYHDGFKASGGWSLERIDPFHFCAGKQNWVYSANLNGGSPGEANAVSEISSDISSPYISRLIFRDSLSCLIRFSECLSPSTTLNKNEITYSEAGISIDSFRFTNIFYNELLIKFSTRKKKFSFKWKKEVADCSGNSYYINGEFLFGQPETALAGDILFSEILYAPFPACEEFIEIYNNSEKILSLSDLRISFSGSGMPEPAENTLAEEDYLIFPGEYLAVSSNIETLPQFYVIPDPPSFFQSIDICSLPDAGGRLAIHNRSGQLIDEMSFSGKDQFPLLTDYHGVSLERIKLDENMGILADWHSASSLCGFATPGYKNSQSVDGDTEAGSSFSLDEEIFTPDNDGQNDVAIFRYSMDHEGYIGTFRIFNASGRIIKTIGESELMGFTGAFFWDGSDEHGQLCSSGIYLGFLEAFHLSGKKKRYKKAVVLSR